MSADHVTSAELEEMGLVKRTRRGVHHALEVTPRGLSALALMQQLAPPRQRTEWDRNAVHEGGGYRGR